MDTECCVLTSHFLLNPLASTANHALDVSLCQELMSTWPFNTAVCLSPYLTLQHWALRPLLVSRTPHSTILPSTSLFFPLLYKFLGSVCFSSVGVSQGFVVCCLIFSLFLLPLAFPSSSGAQTLVYVCTLPLSPYLFLALTSELNLRLLYQLSDGHLLPVYPSVI